MKKIIFTGTVRDTFYVDDMKLVAMKPPEPEPVAVEVSEARAIPSGYALSQNYPNPFNPSTTIAYDLPQAADVTLTLYTITGQQVQVLADGHQQAGHHTVDLRGLELATGVYLYRIEAGTFAETRRMLLLR